MVSRYRCDNLLVAFVLLFSPWGGLAFTHAQEAAVQSLGVLDAIAPKQPPPVIDQLHPNPARIPTDNLDRHPARTEPAASISTAKVAKGKPSRLTSKHAVAAPLVNQLAAAIEQMEVEPRDITMPPMTPIRTPHDARPTSASSREHVNEQPTNAIDAANAAPLPLPRPPSQSPSQPPRATGPNLGHIPVGPAGQSLPAAGIRDGTPRAIRLMDVLRRTLEQNTEIQVRHLDVAAAAAQVGKEEGKFDPQFFYRHLEKYGEVPSELRARRRHGGDWTREAEMRYVQQMPSGRTYSLGGEFDWTIEDDTGSLLNPLQSGRLSATVHQPLLRGANVYFNTAGIRLAHQFRDISQHRFEEIVMNVLNASETAYWEFNMRHENWRDQEQTYLLAGKLEHYARRQAELGVLSQLEYARARTQLANRRVQLMEAATAALATEAKVKGLTNAALPTDGSQEIWTPADQPKFLEPEFEVQEEIYRGLQLRPSVRAAILDLRGQKVRVEVAKHNLLPILHLISGVTTRGISGDDAGQVDRNGQRLVSPYAGDLDDLFDHMFWRDGIVWNIGCSIQFPLFRHEDRAILRERMVVARQAFQRLVRAERTVIREVTIALRTIEYAKIKVKNAIEARQLAEVVYEKTHLQMERGFSDVKRVVDALDELADARIEENKAMAEYIYALVDLERATGVYLRNRNITL